MLSTRETELSRNFDYFRRHLSMFIDEHRGRFALLHNCGVDGFFDDAFDALAVGNTKYPDRMYSIQEVTDESVDLGFWSHAVDQR